jgi:hypothetical protein
MRRDKDMNRLYKRVWVKIVYPDAIFPPKVMTQRAGPKQGFGPDGIDDLLMQTADKLENLFPYWEFQMIELAPQGQTARFVFTFAGYRATVMDQVKAQGEAATIAALEGAELPGAASSGPLADFK